MKLQKVNLGPWPLGVDSRNPNDYLRDGSLLRAENVRFDQAGRVMSLAVESPLMQGSRIVSARYAHQLKRLVAATDNAIGYLSTGLVFDPVWALPFVNDWETGQEYILAANRNLYALPLSSAQPRSLDLRGNTCALVGGVAAGAEIGTNLVEYSEVFADGSPPPGYRNRENEAYRYRLTSGKVTALAGVGYSLFIGTDLGLVLVRGLGTEQETEQYVSRRPVPEYGVAALPGTEVGRSFPVSTNVAVWLDTDGIGIATEGGEIVRPVKDRFYQPSLPRRVSITASNGIILVSEIR